MNIDEVLNEAKNELNDQQKNFRKVMAQKQIKDENVKKSEKFSGAEALWAKYKNRETSQIEYEDFEDAMNGFNSLPVGNKNHISDEVLMKYLDAAEKIEDEGWQEFKEKNPEVFKKGFVMKAIAKTAVRMTKDAWKNRVKSKGKKK